MGTCFRGASKGIDEGRTDFAEIAKYLLDQPTHFLAQMSDNPVQNLFKSVSVVSE